VDTQSSYKTLSVLWLHIVTCEACVLCTVWRHTVYRALYEGILCTVHPHTAITLTTSCMAPTYLLLTKCVIFSQVLIVAPWWWFPCKPKHVGAVLLILKCFNNSTFFNVVCVSWLLKCWILLMHGVTMKLGQCSCTGRYSKGSVHVPVGTAMAVFV